MRKINGESLEHKLLCKDICNCSKLYIQNCSFVTFFSTANTPAAHEFEPTLSTLTM